MRSDKKVVVCCELLYSIHACGKKGKGEEGQEKRRKRSSHLRRRQGEEIGGKKKGEGRGDLLAAYTPICSSWKEAEMKGKGASGREKKRSHPDLFNYLSDPTKKIGGGEGGGEGGKGVFLLDHMLYLPALPTPSRDKKGHRRKGRENGDGGKDRSPLLPKIFSLVSIPSTKKKIRLKKEGRRKRGKNRGGGKREAYPITILPQGEREEK